MVVYTGILIRHTYIKNKIAMINLNLLSECLKYSDTYLCKLLPVKKTDCCGDDSIKYIIRIYTTNDFGQLGISYTLGIISINNIKKGITHYKGKIDIKVLYRIMSQGVRLEWGFREVAGGGYELHCRNVDDNIGYVKVGAFQNDCRKIEGAITREDVLASKNARAALEKLFN